jgi:carboxymethylenebutenolidase
MANETIGISAGSDGEFGAYVSSEGSNRKPALIVCSEAFGVNQHMRNVADRFAKHGFLVVVPDLLWRIEPGMEIAYDEAGLKKGSEVADAFDKELGAADIERSISHIRTRPDYDGKVGVLGFCIGGAAAFIAAARYEVNACISYYGKGIENYLDEAPGLHCPIVLHYGGADRFIPESVIEDVRQGLRGIPDIEIYTYPGVDHGFNSDDRKAYNPAVAQTAMERTLDALNRGLRNHR